MCNTLWLSQYKTGYLWQVIFKSLSNKRIQINSEVAVDKALYSASDDDLDIVTCFFALHDTKEFPIKKQQPLVIVLYPSILPNLHLNNLELVYLSVTPRFFQSLKRGIIIFFLTNNRVAHKIFYSEPTLNLQTNPYIIYSASETQSIHLNNLQSISLSPQSTSATKQVRILCLTKKHGVQTTPAHRLTKPTCSTRSLRA
jgi:hypothetical protein